MAYYHIMLDPCLKELDIEQALTPVGATLLQNADHIVRMSKIFQPRSNESLE